MYCLNKKINMSYHFTIQFYSYCMIASLWHRDYHWLILKHFKVNLFMSTFRDELIEGVRDLSLLSLSSLSDIDRISVCNHCKGDLLKLYPNWFDVGCYLLVPKCSQKFRTFLFAFFLNVAVWFLYRSIIKRAYLWKYLWNCCFIDKTFW